MNVNAFRRKRFLPTFQKDFKVRAVEREQFAYLCSSVVPKVFRDARILPLDIHDQPSRIREFTQAVSIDPVVHESPAPLRLHEASGAQNLKMVRNRWLPDLKMLHDVAHANRIAVRRQQIQNPYPRWIGERFEPPGILPRSPAADLRSCLCPAAAAIHVRTTCLSRHRVRCLQHRPTLRLLHSSINVNESITGLGPCDIAISTFSQTAPSGATTEQLHKSEPRSRRLV